MWCLGGNNDATGAIGINLDLGTFYGDLPIWGSEHDLTAIEGTSVAIPVAGTIQILS